MASIGHVAVGLAAGRIWSAPAASRRQLSKAMVAFAALSMAPDLDVIAFALRIPYQAPFGHRGATHSIAASILAAGLAWLVARWERLPAARSAVIAFCVVLSHALLDMLTTGGLGCALFWPLSAQRFFFPGDGLIPVAPIGLGMLSSRGLWVLLVESVLFLPVWLYAIFPRRRAEAS